MSVELSIVLPVFNEEANLRALDAEIVSVLAELGGTAEVIYVDDGSTDGSVVVLQEILAADPGPVRRLVKLRRNYGQTAALAAGIDHACGQVIVTLDADGQNDPNDIGRLLGELERGADVVSGWRRKRRDKPFSRRLPSWVANHLISWISGVKLHDYGCTLKAYRTKVLRGIHLYGDMHRFIPAYLARTGARISEIPVHHRPRVHGTSHYGSDRIFKVLLDMILIRFMSRYFTRPMHFFGQTGLLLFGLALTAFLLMVTFKYGWLQVIGVEYRASFVETPLPALAATFLAGAILSVFFGILAEVLIRIYHELLELKPYAVEEEPSPD
jgi:glycosyltransferase involved in cell wall biosynthesis